jgi:hypothetical protein
MREIELNWQDYKAGNTFEQASLDDEGIRIVVRKEYDAYADLDWLGHLSHTEQPDAICYLKSPSWFIPARPEQAQADYERFRSYGDTWHMIGIVAEVSVMLPNTYIRLGQSGVWNIENDSDEGHLDTIAREQIQDARQDAIKNLDLLTAQQNGLRAKLNALCL